MSCEPEFNASEVGVAMLRALESGDKSQRNPILIAMIWALYRASAPIDRERGWPEAAHAFAQALADPTHESLDDLRAKCADPSSPDTYSPFLS